MLSSRPSFQTKLAPVLKVFRLVLMSVGSDLPCTSPPASSRASSANSSNLPEIPYLLSSACVHSLSVYQPQTYPIPCAKRTSSV